MLVVDTATALPGAAMDGLLAGSGCRIRHAVGAAMAIVAARDLPADLIMVDARAPGFDALAACRALNAAPETAPTPILLIGSFASGGAIDDARESGADDVLCMPIEASLLRLRVDLLLGLSRSRAMQREASALLHSMGHQVRTPMTAILGMSHLALQGALDAPQRNHVEKIERSAELLLATLGDILDFSSIGAGTFALCHEVFAFADVLDGAARRVATRAEERGLTLLIDAPGDLPLALVGDGARLRQVLIDLGTRAVHANTAGVIVLGVECIGRDATSAQLRFWVRGSDPVPAPTREVQDAAGLENAISRHLIALMRASLVVRDGSLGFSAHFELPGAAGMAPALLADADTRVLIVDGHAEVRRVLGAMCRSLALNPDSAEDGWDAMRQVAIARQVGRPYGLVLLDAQLTGLDGAECARMISAGAAPPPLVLLTTTAGRDAVLRRLAARQVSVRNVLTKPLTPALLRAACAPALQRTDADGAPLSSDAELLRLHRAQLRGARLLLVEDNAIIQEVALELLGSAGIEIAVANNGQEALARLASQRFDGVLMDCQMPVMDGFEATRALRRMPELKQLPVIALTADVLEVDRDRVIQAGMNDFIAKPLDVAVMFATLARWIHPVAAPSPIAPTPPPADADGDPLARLPGIDAKVGRRSTMNNDKLYRRLLGMFLDGQRQFGQQFRSAQAGGDRVTATRLAHNLRAVSGSLGALAVHEGASELERACARGDADAALAGLLGGVVTELDQVIAGLETLPRA